MSRRGRIGRGPRSPGRCSNGDQRWVQSAGLTGHGSRSSGACWLQCADSSTAFRWEAGGLDRLSPITARGVSANGTVVVGVGSSGWRWTRATGTVSIGSIDRTNRSTPVAISGDGNVIVGTSPLQVPFRWTQARGMVDFHTLFPPGVLPADFTIQSANAVSSTGTGVAGTGVTVSGQQEAWRATFGVECSR